MKYSLIFAGAVAATNYPTTIQDYDHHDCTVTAADQSVLVYHTSYTITHTESSKYGGYAAATGYAYPTGTGSSPAAATDGCWYEKYEKMEYVPYAKMGPHALAGYPGSDECEEAEKYQVVYGKEYKNGKWNSYTATHTYALPSSYATTYPAAGTYTHPAETCTVQETSYYAAEATKSYAAGETCTYGARSVKAEKTGVLTVPYATYTVSASKTYPALAYKTITASTTGKYEVCPGTTTHYPEASSVVYPTVSWYAPGVYKAPEATVTASANQAYTCKYELVTKYSNSYVVATPAAAATATPYAPGNAYSYPAAGYTPAAYQTGYQPAAYATGYSASPVAGEEECEETPAAASAAKPYATGYAAYSAAPAAASAYPYKASPVSSEEEECEETPAAASAYPVYSAKPVSPANNAYPTGYPASYPAATPAAENKYPAASPVAAENKYPASYAAAPAAVATPAYPATPSSEEKPYAAKPAAAQETDCEEEEKPASASKGYGYKSS